MNAASDDIVACGLDGHLDACATEPRKAPLGLSSLDPVGLAANLNPAIARPAAPDGSSALRQIAQSAASATTGLKWPLDERPVTGQPEY